MAQTREANLIDRATIRAAMRQQRRELPLSLQCQAAHSISEFIQRQAWFQQASHIAFYAAVRGEVDPYLLLEKACAQGKTCYLPILSPLKYELLEFVSYTPGDPLTINDYGILEPLTELHIPCELSVLDCVFAPLVAFDDKGNRLGSGRGYYDKTFSYLLDKSQWCKTKFIGLGYDFQQLPELQSQSWDVPLDQLVMFDTLCGDVCEVL